jgi:hypothetical protein
VRHVPPPERWIPMLPVAVRGRMQAAREAARNLLKRSYQ